MGLALGPPFVLKLRAVAGVTRWEHAGNRRIAQQDCKDPELRLAELTKRRETFAHTIHSSDLRGPLRPSSPHPTPGHPCVG